MYLVILVFSVLVCAVIGLCGWCLWRFFKKKRPKDGKKKKDGKTDGVSKKKKEIYFWIVNNKNQLICKEKEDYRFIVKREH